MLDKLRKLPEARLAVGVGAGICCGLLGYRFLLTLLHWAEELTAEAVFTTVMFTVAAFAILSSCIGLFVLSRRTWRRCHARWRARQDFRAAQRANGIYI